MQINIKSYSSFDRSDQFNPIRIIEKGKLLELTHGECAGGLISMKEEADKVSFSCNICGAIESSDRTSVIQALRKTLVQIPTCDDVYFQAASYQAGNITFILSSYPSPPC